MTLGESRLLRLLGAGGGGVWHLPRESSRRIRAENRQKPGVERIFVGAASPLGYRLTPQARDRRGLGTTGESHGKQGPR